MPQVIEQSLFLLGEGRRKRRGRLKIFISPPLSLTSVLIIVAEGFFGAKKSRLPLNSKKQIHFDFPVIIQYFCTHTYILEKNLLTPFRAAPLLPKQRPKTRLPLTIWKQKKNYFFPANSKCVGFLIACTKCLLNASLRKM